MLMFPLSSEVIRKYWQVETTEFWYLGRPEMNWKDAGWKDVLDRFSVCIEVVI